MIGARAPRLHPALEKPPARAGRQPAAAVTWQKVDRHPAAGRRGHAAGDPWRPAERLRAAHCHANCMRRARTSPASSDCCGKSHRNGAADDAQNVAATAAVADGLAVWVLISNAASLGLLVLGSVLAIVVPQLTAPFWPEPPRLVRPLASPAFPRRLCLRHRHRQLARRTPGHRPAATACRRPSSKCRSSCATLSSPRCSPALSR
jgi:hypothetical protein